MATEEVHPDDRGRLLAWSTGVLPYQQEVSVLVKDRGNGLPIGILCANADPPRVCDVTMPVRDAEALRNKLSEAIRIAKRAGLK